MACINLKKSREEITTFKFWRDCIFEFFLNVVLLFLSTAVSLKINTNRQPPGLIPSGIVGGLIVFCIIEAFTHVDGAHINPVITILFILSENVSLIKGLFYIIFEVAGAYTGILLLSVVIPKDARALIVPLQLSSGMEPYQGVIFECSLTTILCMVTLGSIDSKRRKVNLPGLMIGFTITIGIYTGAQYTGGCIHPGIVFGPALYSGIWTNHWVYWLGPLLGAPVGWLAYLFFTWEGGRSCKVDTPSQSEVDVDEKGELMEVTTA